MTENKPIIIEDCPYFICGICQEYLDGVCENHKCDLKIIRELEEKLSNKRKECDKLHETVKSQKEEIKNLNYTLYEERNLTTDLAKANLKISTLKRNLSSVRNRFKNENQQNKEIIKAKTQECEELKNNFSIEHAELLNARSKIDELKKQIESDKDLITNAGKQHYQLIQEYDQLKAENEKLKKHNFDYNISCARFEKYVKCLEQKLERIKEIIGNSHIYKEEDYGLDNITRELLQIIDEEE